MNIKQTANYVALSHYVAQQMIDEVKTNPKANLCLPSGGSPTLAYDLFVSAVLKENIPLNHVTFTKLDEWCDLAISHPATCEAYIQEKIIQPLGIHQDKYISMKPDAINHALDVKRVDAALEKTPISLCLLGLGKNGHLGLNEPGESLTLESHVVALDEITKTHPMIQKESISQGKTIGMQAIFKATKVLLMIAGQNKEAIVHDFFLKKITTHLPASLLWLHSNAEVVIQTDMYPR